MTPPTPTSLDDSFSGTKTVAEHLQFDTDALAAYLTQHLSGFKGALSVEQAAEKLAQWIEAKEMIF